MSSLLPSNLTTGGANIGGPESGVLSSTASGPRPQPPSAAIVRIRDVGRVELGAQNYSLACTFDGRPSVNVRITPPNISLNADRKANGKSLSTNRILTRLRRKSAQRNSLKSVVSLANPPSRRNSPASER